MNSYTPADSIVAVTTWDGEAFHVDCINLEGDGPWDGETLPEGFAPVFASDEALLAPCDMCGVTIA